MKVANKDTKLLKMIYTFDRLKYKKSRYICMYAFVGELYGVHVFHLFFFYLKL